MPPLIINPLDPRPNNCDLRKWKLVAMTNEPVTVVLGDEITGLRPTTA